MAANIRTLIVDDHEIIRRGIRQVLQKASGFQIVGEAADGDEAIELARKLEPDLVLMEVALRSGNGIDATRRIKQHRAATIVIMISRRCDLPHLMEAIASGADGFLRNDTSRVQLVEAIRTTVAGGSHVDPLLLRLLLKSLRQSGLMRTLASTSMVSAEVVQTLTVREVMIARLISHGLSNKEISQELTLAVSTVKSHIVQIFRKLRVTDRTQAAVWWVTEGRLLGDWFGPPTAALPYLGDRAISQSPDDHAQDSTPTILMT